MRRLAFLLLALPALAIGCSGGSDVSPTDLAELELHKGHYAQAIAHASQAVRADENDYRAHMIRGRAYHYRNGPDDLKRAIMDFSEAVRLEPETAEPYYSRSMAYRDHGESEKASQDDVTARRLDPQIAADYARIPERPVSDIIDLDRIQRELDEESQKTTMQGVAGVDEEYQQFLRMKERFEGQAKAPAKSGTATRATGDAARKAGSRTAETDEDAFPWTTTSKDTAARGEGAASRSLRGEPPSRESQKQATEPNIRSWLPSAARQPSVPVTNPFARPQVRDPSLDEAPARGPVARQVQSPFQQPIPRPTGFVEQSPVLNRGGARGAGGIPANPFSPLPQRQPNVRQENFQP